MSGGLRAGVNRGDSLCGFNKFGKLSIVGKDPKVAVRAGETGARGDGAARGVKVESGWGSGGWRRSDGRESTCGRWYNDTTRRSG